MGQLLKVGGKDLNNMARALSVSEEGVLNTHHIWEGGFITVLQANIRDTDLHITEPFDISKYSLVSLRIINNCGQPVTIGFYCDSSLGPYLADTEGDIIIQIESKNRSQIITPEDLPFLPYMNTLKFRIFFNTAPTSGTLSIFIAYKR